jgi:hypothetical protein
MSDIALIEPAPISGISFASEIDSVALWCSVNQAHSSLCLAIKEAKIS